MSSFLAKGAELIWDYPVVGLCLFSGIFYTVKLSFIQFKIFFHAIGLITGKYDHNEEEGHISHFQALSAALSGTIGIGNIAGVALSIAIGGPGAVFWLWVAGFLGMATKFAECFLGTYFRKKDTRTGDLRGGPMYYISQGIKKGGKSLALFYGGCLTVGALGIGGMFQSNQASMGLFNQFGIGHIYSGLFLAICVGLVTIGGIRRIGVVASKIVPAMCLLYILGVIYICLSNYKKIPDGFWMIIQDAFTGKAVLGGQVGFILMVGIRRALISNEAGLGSASIAHAAVKTNYPIREGVVASLGPFIDTIVVCTATALAIILTGKFGTGQYQFFKESKIKFERSANQHNLTEQWSITDKKPANTNNLQKFYGKSVLRFKPDPNADPFSTSSQKLIITNFFTSDESPKGIKFSIYHESGKYQAKILGDDGQVLQDYLLTSVSKKSNSKELKGYDQTNKWHSRILMLTPAILAKVKQQKKVVLEFIVPKNSFIYLDNVGPVRELNGITLTSLIFDKYFSGLGTTFITIAALLFAFSTLITWSYYGETAAHFIFGNKAITTYRILFVIITFLGSILNLKTVISFCDLTVGLMVIPNSIGLIILSPIVARETKKYLAKLRSGAFEKSSEEMTESIIST